MTQAPLFDSTLARERGTRGKQRAVGNFWRTTSLIYARGVARQLAENGAAITTDDVYEKLPPQDKFRLGPAAGSIFAGPEWEFVEYRPSRRVSNHGRIIRAWRRKR